MHSCLCFVLETVTVLQYCCPQSGTSLMHTAVAALRNGSGNNASCGSRLLRSAPLRAARPSTLPSALATIRRRTGQFEIRMRFVQAVRGGHVARETPPVCTATNASFAMHVGVRLAVPLLASGDCGACVLTAGAVPHRAVRGWLARGPHCYLRAGLFGSVSLSAVEGPLSSLPSPR